MEASSPVIITLYTFAISPPPHIADILFRCAGDNPAFTMASRRIVLPFLQCNFLSVGPRRGEEANYIAAFSYFCQKKKKIFPSVIIQKSRLPGTLSDGGERAQAALNYGVTFSEQWADVQCVIVSGMFAYN